MFTWSLKSTVGSARQVLWNLGLIALGSVLCAVAINGILVPHQFFAAGFTGVALIIHYLVPSLPVAALYFIFNIPIYVLGWMYVGRRFFLCSIAGVLIFSAALAWPYVSLPVYDKILSALLAGIITGVGSGIILRSLGSAGGAGHPLDQPFETVLHPPGIQYFSIQRSRAGGRRCSVLPGDSALHPRLPICELFHHQSGSNGP